MNAINGQMMLPIRTLRMDMKGLRGAVFYPRNRESVAWDAIKYLRLCEAEVIVICRYEKVVSRLKKLGEAIGVNDVYFCDVEKPEEIDACFVELAKLRRFDFMLHASAWSNPQQLRGRYINMARENFIRTMVVSVDSFRDLARRMEPLMPNGGGMLTLSFRGAERVFPNYNGMGIAKAALESSVRYLAADLGVNDIWVNALRFSPKATPSSVGIENSELIGLNERANSMRNGRATRGQIVQAIGFLLAADSGITGQVIESDNGAGVMGMFNPLHALEAEQAGRDVGTIMKGGEVKFSDGFWDWDE